VRAVIDTSSLVSLARAGLLDVLAACGLHFVLLGAVRGEAVESGLAHGHADAAAIEARIAGWSIEPGAVGASVDEMVLRAASTVGVLISNDLALGRRARNQGTSWLRTADLVLLAVAAGGLTRELGRSAMLSLRDAGRLAPLLAADYLAELS